MPNIASVLRVEIARLARKELRAECDALKKVVSNQRTELAGLKRRVQALEGLVKRLEKVQGPASALARREAATVAGEAEEVRFRFRADGMAANRKRLGLSAADFALLVGATGQSVYAWESGKAKPRGKSLAAIAALRGLGKREVAARLASLKS